MTQDDVFLQRLAYIKYLWLQAEEQTRQPEPFCGYALLSMQDAVEMFLLTGIRKFSADIKKDNFDGFWNSLDSKLAAIGTALSQRPSMQQMNKARVELKHRMTFPGKLQIDEFHILVKAFFAENTPKVFGVDFETVSLADLITNEIVKEHIKKAEEYYGQKELNQSLSECALGLRKLLDHFDKEANDRSRSGNPISNLKSVVHCNRRSEMNNEEFMQKTEKAMEKIDSFIRLTALGIDYGKFIRFNIIAPEVNVYLNNRYDASRYRNDVVDSNSVQYCISFVVECALKEQSFQWWE